MAVMRAGSVLTEAVKGKEGGGDLKTQSFIRVSS